MPRQPLKYVRASAAFEMPANPLAQRPELASLIGECIAFWSHVEAQLAMMLSAIMKTETAIAGAVFLSIRNSRAQREALTAAAQVGLSGRELEMFSAISIVYQSLDAQRTDLAHGIFALTDEIPDGILWVESKDYIKHWVTYWADLNKGRFGVVPDIEDKIREDMFVYRKSDLITLRDEIKEFWGAVFRFSSYLHFSSVGEPNALIESQFQLLYTLPQIQRALARLREG